MHDMYTATLLALKRCLQTVKNLSQNSIMQLMDDISVNCNAGPITKYHSHYIVNVDVVIEVLSARMGTFSVTCTARGGAVLISSLTGPGGVYHELEPVGTPQMRGDDAYSITTRTLSGGNDGDTYQCIATNGVSTPDPSDSETLRGII